MVLSVLGSKAGTELQRRGLWGKHSGAGGSLSFLRLILTVTTSSLVHCVCRSHGCKENYHPYTAGFLQEWATAIKSESPTAKTKMQVPRIPRAVKSDFQRVEPSGIYILTVTPGDSLKHTWKFENHCLRRKGPRPELQALAGGV